MDGFIKKNQTASFICTWYCWCVAIIFLLSCQVSFGSGFQIPNQSLRAIGIAGATIAYNTGPEASYYNPANMAFLEEGWLLETSLTMLHLPSIEYTDNRTSLLNGSSHSEMFYLPQLHFVSPGIGDFRFGFSLTYPYGLAKAWNQPYPAATAGSFSLDVIEASPTFSYKVAEFLSIGGGVRLIYSEGEVRNGVTNPPFFQLSPLTDVSREVEGDDFKVGYAVAATLRPFEDFRVVATYKSEVNLELEGDADLMARAGSFPLAQYSGPGSLDVPLPAVFSLATSYTHRCLTFEVAWNRTFWSAVEDFDFQYNNSFLGTVFDGFDRPLIKDWQDSDAIRFGVTWQVNRSLQTTFGFAVDETPVPERTLGFELPDSDGYMYGLGLQYQVSNFMTLGVSYMYYHTTSRSVENSPVAGMPGIDGSFDDGGAHAVNVGALFTW